MDGTRHFPLTRAIGLDKTNLKVLAIDRAKNVMTTESVTTGEIVTFALKPDAFKDPAIAIGQMHSSAVFGRWGDNGRCACGQRSDGSCWCVSSEPACCGPFHGCPMGGCGGTNPTNDKPIFQTPNSYKP
jgi:hypothetical protein